jgi:hypothetical protein
MSPSFSFLIVFDAMYVCSSCHKVRGPWHRPHTPLKTLVQRCRCGGPRDEPTWEGFDFNTAVELCYCCGQVPIRSGSKWSVLLCADCAWLSGAFNRERHSCVIPFGRHSMVNGVWLKGSEAGSETKRGAFVARLTNLFDQLDLLDSWAWQVVGENLEMAGFPTGVDAPLVAYLDGLARQRTPKRRAFEHLCAFMDDHAFGRP